MVVVQVQGLRKEYPGSGVSPRPPSPPGPNGGLARPSPSPGSGPSPGLRPSPSPSLSRVLALDGLDFAVPAGSIYGFLGPNGAGKTTTLRLLLGQLRPTAGEIRLFGQRVAFPDPLPAAVSRRLAYLPQDPVFPARHTGLEVMELVAALYELDPAFAAARTRELLALLDLESASRRRVETYSRGMKQRLGLATVLLPQPELLLLDEPVSALDPGGRYQILALLGELRGRATVFFSSHILADVERICDHLLILHRGRKVVEGELSDLLRRFDPRRYRVRVRPDQLVPAVELLKKAAWTNAVQPDEESATIELSAYPGSWSQMEEQLLPLLVGSGITVLECYQLRADLESVFLQLLPAEDVEPGHAPAGPRPPARSTATPGVAEKEVRE